MTKTFSVRWLVARSLIFTWPLAAGYLAVYQFNWRLVLPSGGGFGWGNWHFTLIDWAFWFGLLVAGFFLTEWLLPSPSSKPLSETIDDAQ